GNADRDHNARRHLNSGIPRASSLSRDLGREQNGVRCRSQSSDHENIVSTRTVDVGAVLDTEHGDKTDVVADRVQDAEGTPPRGVDPCELVVQRVADPVRLLQQGSGDELDDCCGDAFGQLS
ncbi:MAG: hypothetical protein ACRDV2_00700, partial [Actinomycetes bacterium]